MQPLMCMFTLTVLPVLVLLLALQMLEVIAPTLVDHVVVTLITHLRFKSLIM
jgi:hypothetical protein